MQKEEVYLIILGLMGLISLANIMILYDVETFSLSESQCVREKIFDLISMNSSYTLNHYLTSYLGNPSQMTISNAVGLCETWQPYCDIIVDRSIMEIMEDCT